MKKFNKISVILIMAVFIVLHFSACYVIEVTINFDSNGGSDVASITTNGASKIKIPDNPTKEGYEFKGWYWDNETFNNEFTANTLLDAPIKSDMTVYAKWLPESSSATDPTTYTITFETNGGNNITPITIEEGATITIPANPTRTGYAFKAWYLDADKQIPASNILSETISADITLYADWEINQYTITFETNDGSDVSAITQDYGTDIIVSTAKVGHGFSCWYLDEELTIIQTTVPAQNATLYAGWYTAGLSFNLIDDGYSVSQGTTSVSDVIIPRMYNNQLVIAISNDGFKEFTSLNNIVIPNSIESIGSRAFLICTNLKTIIIPESVNTIGEWAFSGCSSLTSITLPSSVRTVGDNIFTGCVELKDVILTAGITTIGANAFTGCIKLASITIPSSITTLENYTFADCTA